MTESFVFSLETITVYSDFPFGSSHICASCGYVSAEDKCTLRAASPGASGLLYPPCQKNHFYPHINPTTSRSPVARPTEQLCLFLRRPFFFYIASRRKPPQIIRSADSTQLIWTHVPASLYHICLNLFWICFSSLDRNHQDSSPGCHGRTCSKTTVSPW